jgi:hypothetical protein
MAGLLGRVVLQDEEAKQAMVHGGVLDGHPPGFDFVYGGAPRARPVVSQPGGRRRPKSRLSRARRIVLMSRQATSPRWSTSWPGSPRLGARGWRERALTAQPASSSRISASADGAFYEPGRLDTAATSAVARPATAWSSTSREEKWA